MPKFVVFLAIVVLFELGAAAAGRQAVRGQDITAPRGGSPTDGSLSLEAQSALVKQYCVGCHSDSGKAGGLTLAAFDPSRLEEAAPVAEKMIRKLRAGMMPPPNAPRRPDTETVRAFVAAMETRLDQAAAVQPNPGRRTFQRLNRTEYRSAIRDLLDIDVDVDAFLPSDTVSGGFDNIADVQSFSPTLMQGYLRAASQISRLAIGDRTATASSATYSVSQNEGQMRHVEGTPIGTRGGISVVHVFPADGDYVFNVGFVNAGEGELYGGTIISSTDKGEQIEISINGERAALFDLDPWMHEETHGSLSVRTGPIHVSAGPQRISAA
ncbi:MAG TPA: DUF1587 domain-containing protein, partial [Vicinamibacterales bacterium]|nr:DUF1587 domain-containing protein [Vicinamibacterales bacterium]